MTSGSFTSFEGQLARHRERERERGEAMRGRNRKGIERRTERTIRERAVGKGGQEGEGKQKDSRLSR